MRVLLVEDDELLGDGIRTGLKHYGHTVDWVKDGQSANNVLVSSHENFDIVVLDLGLPKLSGLQVLKNIRERNITTPVVILTAKETVDDRVSGLDAGADDYITKPIKPRALLSRINSFYKRASSKVTLSNSLKVGDLDINKDSYVVKLNNKEIFFPKKEFNLLYFLASNPKKVYSRDSLLRNLWGTDVHVVARTVDVHVRKIREKIGPDYISTIKGVGYKFKS